MVGWEVGAGWEVEEGWAAGEEAERMAAEIAARMDSAAVGGKVADSAAAAEAVTEEWEVC